MKETVMHDMELDHVTTEIAIEMIGEEPLVIIQVTQNGAMDFIDNIHLLIILRIELIVEIKTKMTVEVIPKTTIHHSHDLILDIHI